MRIEKLGDLSSYLSSPRKVVIVNHVNPDGDAMGSALGLQHFLQGRGHAVDLIVPNEPPHFLRWLPGYDAVLAADAQSEVSESKVSEADIVFCLDFNALHRCGELLSNWIKASSSLKVMVDHHREPEDWPNYMYSDTGKGSTAEMVYDLIQMWDGDAEITLNIAQSLYVGIVTDTGSFRFSSTTAETHRAAARLIEAGVDPAIIHDHVYDVNTKARLKLLGVMLDNMEIVEERNVAILYLDAPTMQKYGYTKGDSEGFVNYGLSVNGMRMSAFFREDGDVTKCSFRSKSQLDVNTFARTHFNGGGHLNAAGGIFYGKPSDAIALFKSAIEKENI